MVFPLPIVGHVLHRLRHVDEDLKSNSLPDNDKILGMQQKVYISVDVFIFKNGSVLLGKRKNKYTHDYTYAPPGGHLDIGETLRECALREVKEETGLSIVLDDAMVIHENYTQKKHYVIIGFKAKWIKGRPKVLEPQKCIGWDWYALDNLPEPLFANNDIAIKNIKQGIIVDKRKKL